MSPPESKIPVRMWLALTSVSCSDLPCTDDGTCCTVEPVATLPSCFLSSSSSCMDILEAAAGVLKLLLLPAASSALSFAFCCRYCRVWAHMGPGVMPPARLPLLSPDPKGHMQGEGRSPSVLEPCSGLAVLLATRCHVPRSQGNPIAV